VTRDSTRLATTDSSVLDFLRAGAVSLVLVSHLVEASRNHSWWWPAEQVGWMGVMLFFVHTSLVLMFSLDRTPAEGTALLKSFYVRRAFRIYPLSIAVVLIVLVFGIRVASWPWQSPDTSVQNVLANLFLVQNLVYDPNVLGSMWSLPLEIQMYALLPFIYWIVRRGARLDLAVALWGLAVCLALVQPYVTGRANIAQYAPCFMGGVIAFCFAKQRPAVLPFWSWVLALSGTMVAFVLLTGDQAHARLMPASWGLTIAIGWLIPHFRETSSFAIRRISAVIAKYSYGIYLTHMIAFWIAFVKMGQARFSVHALVGLGLTSVFSALAYYLIEAPGIRLGTALANHLMRVKPCTETL
jgi:peptidoglycan/LPS O-acetylase OafA/YrhL